jgi:serine/threonine protein kinase
MGTVYRCTHLELKYPCAIKILLPDWASADPHGRQRMRREALIACRLNHPNLVRVHDCGTNVVPVEDEEGTQRYEEFFLVMDLLEGQSLKDYLLQKGALPLNEAVIIARQVANGLSELHSKGILHRDIKPANVMLTHDYKGDLMVKIVDLGAVKLVERSLALDDVELTGSMMIGSARYTSPENCKGMPLDERSDIYCLGLILYEMLAGCPTFDSNDRVDLYYKHAYGKPRSLAEVCPNTSESVVRLVMSALEKSPEARPQSAVEFARALSDLEAPDRADGVFKQPQTAKEEVDEETHAVARTAFDASPEAKPNLQTVGRKELLSEGRRTALALAYFLAFVMTALFLVWSLLSRAPAEAEAADAPTADTSSEVQVGNSGDDFITATDVNIRSGPSRSSERIGLAEQGSRVRVLSASHNWREVRVIEHGHPKADESSQDQGWLDGGLLRPPDDRGQ